MVDVKVISKPNCVRLVSLGEKQTSCLFTVVFSA